MVFLDLLADDRETEEEVQAPVHSARQGGKGSALWEQGECPAHL